MFPDKSRQIRFHSCLLGTAAGPALRHCEHLLDTDHHVPGHSALWSHKAVPDPGQDYILTKPQAFSSLETSVPRNDRVLVQAASVKML